MFSQIVDAPDAEIIFAYCSFHICAHTVEVPVTQASFYKELTENLMVFPVVSLLFNKN